MEIRFYNELSEPSEFSDELLEEFLTTGYAVEQKIEGKTFIKMTSQYYEDLGEYIIKHPRELCRDYWERLVDETIGYDIIKFIKHFCETHMTISKLTGGQVDFCGIIGEEL